MSKDHELDTYLEGKSALTQLYAELPSVDLPGHLDAAILAEAHRAVGSRPGATSKRRWAIPLGLVATLFVAVMVGLQLPYLLKDAGSPSQQKEERMDALMDQGRIEQPAAAPVVSAKIADAALVIPKKNLEKQNLEFKLEAATSTAAVAEARSTAAQPLPTVPAASAMIAPQSPAKSLAKPIELNKNTGAVSEEKYLRKEKSSAYVGANITEVQEKIIASPVLTPAPARADTLKPAQLNRAISQALKDEPTEVNLRPEDWLVRIQLLQKTGKQEEARKELVEFKKRHPNYPVPESMESK